jgi:hypothetical protein
VPPSVPQCLTSQVQEYRFQVGLHDVDALDYDVLVRGQVQQPGSRRRAPSTTSSTVLSAVVAPATPGNPRRDLRIGAQRTGCRESYAVLLADLGDEPALAALRDQLALVDDPNPVT